MSEFFLHGHNYRLLDLELEDVKLLLFHPHHLSQVEDEEDEISKQTLQELEQKLEDK